MSRKGENIYKRKDGRWEGRYIRIYDNNGKARYGSVYGKTYNEVKQKLEEKKTQTEINISISRFASYGEVLDAWLGSSRINAKESTYVRYADLVDTHIRPQLGKYQIAKISTQLMESFIAEKLENGRVDNQGGLSVRTVTDILTVIKMSFRYANDNNIETVCNPDNISIRKPDRQIRILSEEEQAKFIKVLLSDTDLFKFGCLLALFTGIRIGELCALQGKDMDLDNGILKINKTLQRIRVFNASNEQRSKIIITPPKSNTSIRDIPLPPFLVDIAKEFTFCPDDYIVKGKDGNHTEPRTVQYRFKAYIKESGIDDINFHVLRHTFATSCIKLGFDAKSLSEILGHADVKTTLNTYLHSSFEQKCEHMKKLKIK